MEYILWAHIIYFPIIRNECVRDNIYIFQRLFVLSLSQNILPSISNIRDFLVDLSQIVLSLIKFIKKQWYL